MRLPRGFAYAGVHAGIKAARKDMALVYSDAPCAAAGCFTVNAARAAPVSDAAARLPASGVRAIVVNSGNANALTGPAGEADVRSVRQAAAKALGVDEGAVLCASTGVIGVRLPVAKMVAAAPALAAARGPAIELAAEAILTTDTRVKLAHRVLRVGGKEVRIAAFAKGSGMVAPAMATVLGFLTTDAVIDAEALAAALAAAMPTSFEALNIDGEMSTNDAVIALANGLASHEPIRAGTPEFAHFAQAVEGICQELARAIAEDGEGATKALEVKVSGAPTVEIARDLARAIAGGTLVKAAVFGADPNWGRVLAVVGARVGKQRLPIDVARASVEIQGTCVYTGGAPTSADPALLRAKMREPSIVIEVRLVEGAAAATAWGCDLSYDYVKINADYMSLTSASSDGTVSRDDRLTNYSPGFKRALLVEALSYIAQFNDTRAVIKYGGAAMVKDSLKASFANDVNLLREAGLLPIVVHGGGPEIKHALQKLAGGKKGEFVDGVRIMTAEDVKVVEMVLSGKINTELVSLLNQSSAHAVGVSGKDAGLLRVKKQLGEGGRDLGMVGEITAVNAGLLEHLLAKQYVPVVSPVGLGEDGEGYDINADHAAAELAVALRAEKLIYLTDVMGVLENGELVSEMSADAARAKIDSGAVKGGMLTKLKAALRALDGGVKSVHVIDGRTPHSVIAELFTDRGVGTLIRGE